MQTIKHWWSGWVAVEEETQANRAHSLSLPEHSCSASVYPQTSPLVNRLGLNPAVSFFLRLSLPPSLCLLACLFTSAPLLYSCDGRWKNRVGVVGVCVWGGEKREKRKSIYVCVCVWEREGGERWDRCWQCKNCFACFACMIRLWKCSAQAKVLFKNRLWETGFLACGQTSAGKHSVRSQRQHATSEPHAYTYTGPNCNYRGLQTRGQPTVMLLACVRKPGTPADWTANQAAQREAVRAVSRGEQAADTWKTPNRLNTH